MSSRYTNRIVFRNDQESYEEVFEKRQVPYIRQYGTPRLRVPTVGERMRFSEIRHVWKVGDRYYKLAIKYYKDSQYWWVIALYNKMPTEGHLRVGDVITIPLPLEEVLRTLGT